LPVFFYQTSAELIELGGKILSSEISKAINFVWKWEYVFQQGKLFNAALCKNCDETSCSNYHAISLLPAEYQILSSILLPRLTSYVDEITGGFPLAFKCTG